MRIIFIQIYLPVDFCGTAIFRTLWPEKEWLEARCGGQASRWRHLWNVVGYACTERSRSGRV